MLVRLILLVAAGFAVLWLLNWFRKTPPAQVARMVRKVAFWGVVSLLVLAAATGRLNPIVAAVAALVPTLIRVLHLAQLLPALQQALRSLGIGASGAGPAPGRGPGGAGGRAGPRTSSIRTRFLEMRLDHGSGAMDGEVLEGPFAGRRLSTLALDQLLRMLELYREQDMQSATLLESYLDREQGPDWRERVEAGGYGRSGPGSGPMGETEALAILGLKLGASPDEIREAHRRLMQRLHPDRGGTDYLAAKINEAKRALLGERA